MKKEFNLEKNKFLNFIQSIFFSSFSDYALLINFSNQQKRIFHKVDFSNFYRLRIGGVKKDFNCDKSRAVDFLLELKNIPKVLRKDKKDFIIPRNPNPSFYYISNFLLKQSKIKRYFVKTN